MTKFFCIPGFGSAAVLAVCILLSACSSVPELEWILNPASGVSAAVSGDRVLLSRGTEQQIITIFSADTIKIFPCKKSPYFFLCSIRTGEDHPLLLRVSLPEEKTALKKYRMEELTVPENCKSVLSVSDDGTSFTGTTDKGTETWKAAPVK